MSEEEFNDIVSKLVVPPFKPDFQEIQWGAKLPTSTNGTGNARRYEHRHHRCGDRTSALCAGHL